MFIFNPLNLQFRENLMSAVSCLSNLKLIGDKGIIRRFGLLKK